MNRGGGKQRRGAMANRAILALLAAMAALQGASAATNCTVSPCQNDGLCVDHVCSCLTGYAGDLCETAQLSQVEGDWLFFLDTYTTTNTPPGMLSLNTDRLETVSVLSLGADTTSCECCRGGYYLRSGEFGRQVTMSSGRRRRTLVTSPIHAVLSLRA